MAPSLEKTIYVGAFVHSKSLQELEICQKGAIGVDENGTIAFVKRNVTDPEALGKDGWESAKIVKVGENGFFFPGFIGKESCHFHNPEVLDVFIYKTQASSGPLNTYLGLRF